MRLTRRSWLAEALGALTSTALGCGRPAEPPRLAAEPEEAGIVVPRLDALLALADLRWIILTRPRQIASTPWLIPSIAKVVPEENFARFSEVMRFDLRQLHEAIVASYAHPEDGSDASTFYLLRHNADPRSVEAAFRERITSDYRRVTERHDVAVVSGLIGNEPRALVLLGRDVVGFQVGGDVRRGPARIASLYAQGKLRRAPTALSEAGLGAFRARFGEAPVIALARGPFRGELGRGARGLLAGATALGAAARLSAREGVGLSIAVAGDFSKSGEAASAELLTAYEEVASGSFGRLLGLDEPVERPLGMYSAEAVSLAVELDAARLATGLHDATGATVEELMR